MSPEAIPLRLALWLERGGDRLSFAEGKLARALVGDGAMFEGDRRVPCHRDYQLRNWILDRRDRPATLGVIAAGGILLARRRRTEP